MFGGWEVVVFGGDGDVAVEDGAIVLNPGDPLTGITSTLKDLPVDNYEISLETKKIDGVDFFCCLTFPVNDSHCSFVVGGWAGTVVGISSIDESDAARNETMKHGAFKADTWYKIRVRVEGETIQCWIDDEQYVNVNVAGRKLTVRNEVRLNRPLGICSFQTKAAIRNIELTRLTAETVKSDGGAVKTDRDGGRP
ncbi:MAG: DUF1080 domain-containing protein [Pirellulaceae bacterium]